MADGKTFGGDVFAGNEELSFWEGGEFTRKDAAELGDLTGRVAEYMGLHALVLEALDEALEPLGDQAAAIDADALADKIARKLLGSLHEED